MERVPESKGYGLKLILFWQIDNIILIILVVLISLKHPNGRTKSDSLQFHCLKSVLKAYKGQASDNGMRVRKFNNTCRNNA